MIERQLDLVAYTGTSGVIELEDVHGDSVAIYLYEGDKLPVPRYYWRVLHDPQAGLGVAVVGINNPHLTVRHMSQCQSHFIIIHIITDSSGVDGRVSAPTRPPAPDHG